MDSLVQNPILSLSLHLYHIHVDLLFAFTPRVRRVIMTKHERADAAGGGEKLEKGKRKTEKKESFDIEGGFFCLDFPSRVPRLI